MSIDFHDATERHWRDAELLSANERWPNADQLYGLAAECGLKTVMTGLGMAVAADGDPQDRRYRHHIDKLWDEFHTFAAGAGAAAYSQRLATENPFSDWRVEQRYWRTSAVAGTTVVARHRDAAERIRALVAEAFIDGRIAG